MLLQALKKKLEGDVAVAKANVLIYKQKLPPSGSNHHKKNKEDCASA